VAGLPIEARRGAIDVAARGPRVSLQAAAVRAHCAQASPGAAVTDWKALLDTFMLGWRSGETSGVNTLTFASSSPANGALWEFSPVNGTLWEDTNPQPKG